jgi:predicted TIM-barrel fold metal-dependent hydrolase
MAHSWNVAIAKLLKTYPDRLVGGALVALQDVEGAIREMEWARRNGFQALILDKVFPVKEHCFSDPYGSHRELWPFFERAEALGMPLFLHNIQHGHRITNLPNYQYNGLDVLAPQEGQMSLVSLITSGLLDDFPKLNFVFTEAGVSFIKPLVAHLDAAFNDEIVDYEAEDAAPRFNYRKLEGGRRIVSPEASPLRTTRRRTRKRRASTSRPICTSRSRRKNPSSRKPSAYSARLSSCSRPTTPTTIRAAA